jgi:8-oxo-dGTP pyrophosphatase MutT (NUDIX family)
MTDILDLRHRLALARTVEPRLLPYRRRAAVALILRPHPTSSCMQLLYILRAANPRDRWSKQVGFPGGRQQRSDVSDWATAVRETREEIGLDLTTDFETVLRLHDHWVLPLSANDQPLAICPFGTHIYIICSTRFLI